MWTRGSQKCLQVACGENGGLGGGSDTGGTRSVVEEEGEKVEGKEGEEEEEGNG